MAMDYEQNLEVLHAMCQCVPWCRMPLHVNFFEEDKLEGQWQKLISQQALSNHISMKALDVDDLENNYLIASALQLEETENHNTCDQCNGVFIEGETKIVSCPMCHKIFHARCAASFFSRDNSGSSKGLMPSEGKCPICEKTMMWAQFVGTSSNIFLTSNDNLKIFDMKQSMCITVSLRGTARTYGNANEEEDSESDEDESGSESEVDEIPASQPADIPNVLKRQESSIEEKQQEEKIVAKKRGWKGKGKGRWGRKKLAKKLSTIQEDKIMEKENASNNLEALMAGGSSASTSATAKSKSKSKKRANIDPVDPMLGDSSVSISDLIAQKKGKSNKRKLEPAPSNASFGSLDTMPPGSSASNPAIEAKNKSNKRKLEAEPSSCPSMPALEPIPEKVKIPEEVVEIPESPPPPKQQSLRERLMAKRGIIMPS